MTSKNIGVWAAAIGMIMAIAGALWSGSARITRLEGACQMNEYKVSNLEGSVNLRLAGVEKKLDQIDAKFDKLLERSAFTSRRQ